MKGFAERRRVRLHPVSRMWKTTSTRRNTTVLLGVLGEPVGILVDKLIAPLAEVTSKKIVATLSGDSHAMPLSVSSGFQESGMLSEIAAGPQGEEFGGEEIR